MNEQYIIEMKNDTIPEVYKYGHDVYIKIILKSDNKSYFIPVMLPRRDPELNYFKEISKGILSDNFYEYLDLCSEKLLSKNVEIWKRDILEKIDSDINLKSKFLKLLLQHDLVCSACFFAPITNNPQKQVQFLRDSGYVISTHRAVFCPKCGRNEVHYALTPILSTDKNNYEQVSKKLKEKICKVFNYTDVYTEMYNPSIEAFIPDHKFPEDRWDETVAQKNSDEMTKEEIISKFQLLSTQSNFHKQRHCALCITEGKRGYPYGIKYYYKGSEEWDEQYPQRGKDAEKGCVGCGWYDLLEWKKQLNKKINGED